MLDYVGQLVENCDYRQFATGRVVDHSLLSEKLLDGNKAKIIDDNPLLLHLFNAVSYASKKLAAINSMQGQTMTNLCLVLMWEQRC